jgi:hypothetical protein
VGRFADSLTLPAPGSPSVTLLGAYGATFFAKYALGDGRLLDATSPGRGAGLAVASGARGTLAAGLFEYSADLGDEIMLAQRGATDDTFFARLDAADRATGALQATELSAEGGVLVALADGSALAAAAAGTGAALLVPDGPIVLDPLRPDGRDLFLLHIDP